MKNPLEKLWKDRCTIYQQMKFTDPVTKLTDFIEVASIENQPCKLSFERLNISNGYEVSTVTQSIKLFISSDIFVPAGSKIVIKRFNLVEREFVYSKSGESLVFSNHQEIQLSLFKGYA